MLGCRDCNDMLLGKGKKVGKSSALTPGDSPPVWEEGSLTLYPGGAEGAVTGRRKRVGLAVDPPVEPPGADPRPETREFLFAVDEETIP